MITILIIILTCFISFTAFNRNDFFAKFQFNPYRVYKSKEWYRIITHGFLHADYTHLIFNMFTLFFFGRLVEYAIGKLFFIILYISAICIASLTTLIKHKNNYLYNSVGASGGVSAIVFASILFSPIEIIYLYFIPIPGFIFAILYLLYSHYMSKRNQDNINHDAHLLGAIYGFLFPLIIDIENINYFFYALFGFKII